MRFRDAAVRKMPCPRARERGARARPRAEADPTRRRVGAVLVGLAVGWLLAGPALADVNAGAQRSASCAHCHGTDGNSSSGAYPNLAGQQKEYLYRQIKAFKDGTRKDAQMSPMVGILSDEEMRDLADFYADQSARRGTFQPDALLAAQGKKIAEERQCAVCHQPNFKRLNEIPRLTRQKHPYLVKQLKDYRDGARTTDAGIMAPSVKGMTDEQIEALCQYLASL